MESCRSPLNSVGVGASLVRHGVEEHLAPGLRSVFSSRRGRLRTTFALKLVLCIDRWLTRDSEIAAMSVASMETTLELWASALREVKARMRPLAGGIALAPAQASGRARAGWGFRKQRGGVACTLLHSGRLSIQLTDASERTFLGPTYPRRSRQPPAFDPDPSWILDCTVGQRGSCDDQHNIATGPQD